PEEKVIANLNLPASFELGQNYPNPFNPTTTIQYALPEPAQVELTIFNTLGQVVRTLMDGHQGAGYHQIVWDGKDEAGRSVSTGIYLYQIKAGDLVETKKMQLIK
ncbi:MAG: T9SS type A sorting domain-containing protein, partial [candidate division Zixibacteria bacterium]|nr:T9SS type A sorting domain-containing protein [candidate division Zixibacteria bacterium]